MVGFLALSVVCAALDSFALRAERQIEVEDYAAVVSGDLGANESVDLQRSASVVSVHAPRVSLKQRADAQTVFTDRLAADRTATVGRVFPFDGVPTAPPLTVGAPGTTNVDIGFLRTRRLPAGRYGHLRIEAGARLELLGGDYTFASVTVSLAGRLVALSASHVGTTGPSRFGLLSSVTVRDPLSARALTVSATHDVSFSIGTVLHALVQTDHQVRIGALSRVRGAIVARGITIEQGTRVTHEDGFTSSSPECPSGCDDANPCTADACTGGVCTHDARTGASCSDNNACTS